MASNHSVSDIFVWLLRVVEVARRSAPRCMPCRAACSVLEVRRALRRANDLKLWLHFPLDMRLRVSRGGKFRALSVAISKRFLVPGVCRDCHPIP